MRLGQVRYVDVVPDRGPVRSGIVSPVDLHRRALAERGFDGNRNQMSLRIVLFPDLSVGVCAGRVKIAQGHPAQSVGRPVPVEEPFHHALRLSVRVDGVLEVVFGDGHLPRNPISRAGRGENGVAYSHVDQALEQVQRVRHVIAEILPRAFHGLSHVGAGGKVNHRSHLVGPNHLADQAGVRQVTLNHRAPLHRPTVSGTEIVQNHRLEARARQELRRMAADVTRAARDQYSNWR